MLACGHNELLALVIHKIFIRRFRDAQRKEMLVEINNVSWNKQRDFLEHLLYTRHCSKETKFPASTELIFYAVGIAGGEDGSRTQCILK